MEENKMDENKENQAPQPIKIGEKEYSQDELSSLVGLGETAREFETKWNRKIDQFYPDYTQKSQKLAEFEKKEAEREQAELKAKAEAGNLSPEEARRIALEEARNLGIVTKDDFNAEVNKTVMQILDGKALLNDAQVAVEEAKEKYGITTTVDAVFKHMKEVGFRNPEKAIKDMFESQIDAWKEAQLGKIKQPGLDTQSGSQAGSKQPEPPAPITSRDALSAAVAARIRGAN